MESGLPLPALLSQAYVAFAIEFDNEFEHQTPHRTTNYGSTPGFPTAPWLISMPFWLRFMRHIPLEGITAADLQGRLAISRKGMSQWVTRLARWWGYLRIVDPAPGASAKRIVPNAFIHPTAGGRKAIEVWRTLVLLVESRWRERFGMSSMDALQDSLREAGNRLDTAAPPHFAVVDDEDKKARARLAQLAPTEAALPDLLSRTLLAFASEFDAQSAASLLVSANVLRVTPDAGIRVRDLPRLSCLSPSGVADALRQLAHERLGVVGADPDGGRFKVLTITSQARLARNGYIPLAVRIEEDWKKRFSADTVHRLRASLEEIVQSRDGGASPLLAGLTPYPEGWRAQLPPLEGLPHFPMVSHRGGFPDGS